MKPSHGKQKLYPNILLAYALTILVLLLSSAFTGSRLWGLSWYGYFAPYGLLCLLAIGLGLPLWLYQMSGLRSQEPPEKGLPRFSLIFVASVLVVACGLLFYFLRTETHFLGDGYLLLSRLEDGAVPIRPWNKGVYYALDSLHRLVRPHSSEAALFTFQIVSWFSGLLFVLASAATAGRLFSTFRCRILFILGVMTGGYSLMFFGYVENYPLFISSLLLFALAGLLITNGSLNRWMIVVPVLLGGAFHPYAIAMVPAAAYVLVRDSLLERWYVSLGAGTRKVIPLSGLVVAAAAFLYVYSQSYFLRFAIVPLLEDRFTIEGYSLFSVAHLIDFGNLLFQLLPALPLLLVLILSSRSRDWLARPPYRFLLLLAIPSLLIAFLFDPKLGMPRDWDMFGFVGIPMTLLLFYYLLDYRNKIKGYAAIAVLALCLNGLVLAPRVATQAIPSTAIEVFDNYSQLDVIKNGTGRFLLLQYLESHGQKAEADRRRRANTALSPHVQWDREGATLMKQGRLSQAVAKFRQAVKLAPSFGYSWTNLGNCFVLAKQFDSALYYLKISDGLNPYNSDTYNGLGFAYLNTGDTARAETYLLGAIRFKHDNLTARTNLLKIYQLQDRQRECEDLMVETAAVDGAMLEIVKSAAGILLEREDFEQASLLYQQLMERGLDSASVRALEAKYPQLDLQR